LHVEHFKKIKENITQLAFVMRLDRHKSPLREMFQCARMGGMLMHFDEGDKGKF
jgi:hypothetical protein